MGSTQPRQSGIAALKLRAWALRAALVGGLGLGIGIGLGLGGWGPTPILGEAQELRAQHGSSSDNYQMPKEVLAGGGGSGASSAYQANGTAGQLAVGSAQSSNFRLIAGFWGEAQAPPPPQDTPAVFRVDSQGKVYSDRAYYCGKSGGGGDPPGPPCFNTGRAADIAERVDVSEFVSPGDVVEVDPQHPGRLRKSRLPYSPLVVGVIAAIPGFVLANLPQELRLIGLFQSLRPLRALLPVASLPLTVGTGERSPWPRATVGALTEPLKGRVTLGQLVRWRAPGLPGRPLLALMGRVKVKATAENGPISPGDLLVSASRPGYAMRCPDPGECEGAVIGKALEPLEHGVGEILVLLMR